MCCCRSGKALAANIVDIRQAPATVAIVPTVRQRFVMSALASAIPATNFTAVTAARLATIAATPRVVPVLKPAKTVISNFVPNV